MQIETLLKINPVSVTLDKGKYSLFYDATLEYWMVTKGVRRLTTVIETVNFEAAFREWVRLSKADVPPF